MNPYPSSIGPSLDIPPPGFFMNEHPRKGVGVETQQQPVRNYVQRSRQQFSEDAKQFLFAYRQCEPAVRRASGDAK